MPGVFVPAKSPTHRLACLSLYRALLRQCSNFPLSAVSSSSLSKTRSTLGNVVRFRFNRDKRFVNWQHIIHALQFGRGALQLLQVVAGGSPSALKELTTILSSSVGVATHRIQTLRAVRAERGSIQLSRKYVEVEERETWQADKSNHRRKPDTAPVLQRPVPYEQALKHKDGRRKVPHYVVANGVPFLRYTRRQPIALSRYIKWQIKEYEKHSSMKEKQDQAIAMAELEDEWDEHLLAQHGSQFVGLDDEADNGSGSWADVEYNIRRDSAAKVKEIEEKRLEYGQKLFDVYLEEKELANQEKEVRIARKEARRLKRLESRQRPVVEAVA